MNLPSSSFIAGLDLGKRQDYSALAVLEHRRFLTGFDPVRFCGLTGWDLRVRRLTRFPLGSSYRGLASRVAAELRTPPLGPAVPLVVDATGLGDVVCELLQDSIPHLVPVVITGGSGRPTRAAGRYRVPKEDLVRQLARLLEQDRLRVARRLPLAATLQQELRNIGVRLAPRTGHAAYGASRPGTHDDLAMAVALACWYVPRLLPEPAPPHTTPLCLFGA
jgi:hypothetical protein